MLKFGSALLTVSRRVAKDDAGVTAVEYGLFAALIAAAIAAIVGTIGSHLVTTLTTVANAL
jgi:pilus assembly protein Flp/PilA